MKTPPSSEGAHRARAKQQTGSDPANDQSNDGKHWKELEQYHSRAILMSRQNVANRPLHSLTLSSINGQRHRLKLKTAPQEWKERGAASPAPVDETGRLLRCGPWERTRHRGAILLRRLLHIFYGPLDDGQRPGIGKQPPGSGETPGSRPRVAASRNLYTRVVATLPIKSSTPILSPPCGISPGRRPSAMAVKF